jgi:hypothetical protein
VGHATRAALVGMDVTCAPLNDEAPRRAPRRTVLTAAKDDGSECIAAARRAPSTLDPRIPLLMFIGLTSHTADKDDDGA